MKKLLIGLLLAVSPALATAPGPVTLGPEYIWNATIVLATTNGVATSFVLTAYYRHDITFVSGGSLYQQPASNPQSVSLDLVANASNTVCTVNSVNYTGAQVEAILAAVAAQARAAQGGPF